MWKQRHGEVANGEIKMLDHMLKCTLGAKCVVSSRMRCGANLSLQGKPMKTSRVVFIPAFSCRNVHLCYSLGVTASRGRVPLRMCPKEP